jgi:hypothetical protein
MPRTTTTTTTTTTTVRRAIRVPKRKPARLVKRERKIVIRTAVAKSSKAKARIARRAAALPAVRRAEVLAITTTPARALPAPKKRVSELTVRERQEMKDARGI